VSGLNDMDYPSVNGLVSGMSNVKHVITTNKVPLPPEVMEHYGRILFCRIIFLVSSLSSFVP
jgi:nuclear pore complex protein Nup155